MVAKHAKAATKLAQQRSKQGREGRDEEIDELEINPANAEFLRGIDLGDTSEEEEPVQEDCGDDEEEAKWS